MSLNFPKSRGKALFFACLVSARADILTLRNGTKVTGTWLGGDTAQIKFVVNDEIRAYPRLDVSEVTFVSELPHPPAKSTGTSGQEQIFSVTDRAVPPPVKLGQTIDEVEAALGKPARLFDNLPGHKRIYIYKEPPVKVIFQDGKVIDTQ